jgi:hypothetical protein
MVALITLLYRNSESAVVGQIVVLLFTSFTTKWIVKPSSYGIANEAEGWLVDVHNSAAHPAPRFVLIAFSFEHRRTIRADIRIRYDIRL